MTTSSPVKIWRRQKNNANLIHQKGIILLWTIIRTPAKAYVGQAPFPVVVVKMADGEKRIGQLVDYQQDQLKKGQAVVAVLRRARIEGKEDAIIYHIKFKPE